MVYLDDVIFLSNKFDHNIRHVNAILTNLDEAGVTLNINKCHFFQKQVEYLGNMIKYFLKSQITAVAANYTIESATILIGPR